MRTDFLQISDYYRFVLKDIPKVVGPPAAYNGKQVDPSSSRVTRWQGHSQDHIHSQQGIWVSFGHPIPQKSPLRTPPFLSIFLTGSSLKNFSHLLEDSLLGKELIIFHRNCFS